MSIEIGTRGMTKVGRNQLVIEVLHEMSDGIYQVRNLATGSVMTIAENRISLTPAEEVPAETTPEHETEDHEAAENAPSTPSLRAPRHAKSLMAIALETLETEARAMSVGEILETAKQSGLFQPEDWGKTPQQTLYGAFVRETKEKHQPRIIKSEVRGKWLLASLPEAAEVTQTAEA